MNFQSIRAYVLAFIDDEDGLTIVEYAVAGGLITLGGNVSTAITSLGCAVKGQTC